ncbi:MAG: exodeoxyribonuclease VII large subunit [Bacilli bacterium]
MAAREISNLKTYSSGHTYFTLKDEEGSISAVLFKGYSRAVSFQLREGMKVFLYGEIAVYEVRGCYQMVVKAALPDGTDLARRFEELKAWREGLSTRSAKTYPRLGKNCCGDFSNLPLGFLQNSKAQGMEGKVYILPAKVQGIGSAAELQSA